MTKKIAVIDLETSIKNRGVDAVGKMKASPHSPKNDVVYKGVKIVGNDKTILAYKDPTRVPETHDNVCDYLLVGQNIKFDLLYYMRNKKFRDEQLPKCSIWDTMLAEYLLTGQESTMTNLDTLALKYGGTVKDDRLKEFWNNDIDTEDIDEDIVIPYLQDDLINTEIVFLGQLEKAKELNMIPLIKSQMDALLATTEMEYNGMYFDKVAALDYAYDLRDEIEDAEIDAYNIMANHIAADINVGSSVQLSKVFFGGEEEYTIDEIITDADGKVVRFKTGTRKGLVKTKKVKKTRIVEGMGLLPERYGAKLRKDKKNYTVGDDVLKNIIDKCTNTPDAVDLATAVSIHRTLSKDLKTYYEGYSDLVWPHDNCIHPQFNHCVTATGRLSHSAPNLGNVSHNKE